MPDKYKKVSRTAAGYGIIPALTEDLLTERTAKTRAGQLERAETKNLFTGSDTP